MFFFFILFRLMGKTINQTMGSSSVNLYKCALVCVSVLISCIRVLDTSITYRRAQRETKMLEIIVGGSVGLSRMWKVIYYTLVSRFEKMAHEETHCNITLCVCETNQNLNAGFKHYFVNVVPRMNCIKTIYTQDGNITKCWLRFVVHK